MKYIELKDLTPGDNIILAWADGYLQYLSPERYNIFSVVYEWTYFIVI